MDQSRDTLLYTAEHLNCFLYNSKDSIIGLYYFPCGTKTSVTNTHNRIVFLLKGKISFLYGSNPFVLEENDFMLIPRSYLYEYTVLEDVCCLVIKLSYQINFCAHYPLEALFKTIKKKLPPHIIFSSLKINKTLTIFVENIVTILADGLKCVYLVEKKQQEMLYYLRAYYPKEELAFFFAPMYNYDAMFAELIYKHYESVQTIEELATIVNYSISGFKKRFAKVFGISPYQWIQKEKAKKIYHEINCSNDSFKEISARYNFFSPSHFDKFCKKMYKMSPGTLRANTACSILEGGNLPSV
jgi:AraC-like DNA-binding protein